MRAAWIGGGIVLGAAILLAWPRRRRSAGGGKWSLEDRDYLARVLVVEAGDLAPGREATDHEWAAIGWVAINRALRDRMPIRRVVASTSWFGGGARGEALARLIQAAPGHREPALPGWRTPVEHPHYSAALTFAGRLLDGRVPNPVGPRRYFLHPQGMPRTDAPDGAQVNGRGEPDPEGGYIAWGGRALPPRMVPEELGGRPEHPPIRVERVLAA